MLVLFYPKNYEIEIKDLRFNDVYESQSIYACFLWFKQWI